MLEIHYDSSNTELSRQTISLDAAMINTLNSISINANAVEATCDHIKLSIITDDATPPVVENTWYITTGGYTPSSPLKFVKTGNSVAVTGGIQLYGAFAPLPTIAVYPSVPSVNVVMQSTFAHTENSQHGFSRLKTLYFQPKSDGVFANETDGFIRCYAMTGRGQFAFSEVAFTEAKIRSANGFRDVIKSAFDLIVASINSQAGASDIISEIKTITDPSSSMYGTEVVTLDATPSANGVNGAYPIALCFIHSISIDPVRNLTVVQYQQNQQWVNTVSDSLSVLLGTIKSTGDCRMYRGACWGLNLSTKLINYTYTV